jgi:alkanesulfonate monooxygenase SsuD/methylene tetrahydromethanopterin reductase-like flavin-dependent oxidoreductase (luciferase family)
MTGLPVVAAETDAEAKRLATSAALRHLNLIRGEPLFVPPPVASMDGLWSEAERQMVESRLSVAAVGGPETIRRKLAVFLSDTQADEVMITSDVYDHKQRLRSFEIAADAKGLRCVARDAEGLKHYANRGHCIAGREEVSFTH